MRSSFDFDAAFTDVLKCTESDPVDYNIALNKARTLAEACEVLKAMQSAGVATDVVTLGTLVKIIPSFYTALAVVEGMRERGLQGNVVVYNTLLNKARGVHQMLEAVNALVDAYVVPDVCTFTTIISKAPSFTLALQAFKVMLSLGIAPNERTRHALFSKTSSEADCTVVDQAWERAPHRFGARASDEN